METNEKIITSEEILKSETSKVNLDKTRLTTLGYLPEVPYRIAMKTGIARRINLKNKNIFQLKKIFKRYPNLREVVALEVLNRAIKLDSDKKS